jgi:hypothetical protein
VTKYDGLGAVKYLAALMTARWTIDGLAHQVSIGDKDAREKLAASMTISEYEKIFDDLPETDVAAAYRKRVWLDFSVLGAFCLVFLALTILALKRKDVL